MNVTLCDTSQDPYYLMQMPKDQLVRYAHKVKTALPSEGVLTSGRKADIAWSIVVAIKNNPRQS